MSSALFTTGTRQRLIDMLRRLPLTEAGLGCIFFLAAYVALLFTRVPGHPAVIWPANAAVAALLVRLPRVRWVWAGLSLAAAGMLANRLTVADSSLATIGMIALNLFQIAATTWLLRFHLRFPVPHLSLAAGIRMWGLFAILIPALTALPGGAIVHAAIGLPFWDAAAHWWSAGAIGACLFAPAIYLYSAAALRRLISVRFLAENITLTVVSLVGTWLAIRYVRFPFTLMAIPLMFAAFRMGAFGAALLCALTGLTVMVLWSLGFRPQGQELIESAAPLASLPFLALAATVLVPIAVGLGTEERRLMTRALADERERLRTTLRSIAEAVITTDAAGCITYLNAAAEALIDQSFTRIAGRNLNEVVILAEPHTARPATSTLAQCIASGEIVRRAQPCLLERRDGSNLYIIDAASPVFDAERRITGTVVVLRDASAEYARDCELTHRANHDVLTGLSNRFEFERCLRESYERALRHDAQATMLVIDLDRFKEVNDHGGHAAGDAVLRAVAVTLRSAVRESDVVARLGGDEFAILLDGCNPARASDIGYKILHALLALEVDWRGTRYKIAASIGAAVISDRFEDAAAWLAAADGGCYLAKRLGRAQMQFAPPSASFATLESA